MRRITSTMLTITLIAPVAAVAGGGQTASAATPRVVINELHFNPEDDDPASEFIELLNTTGSAIDLGGWCIDGISYCFPGGSSIPARGYIVRTGAQYPNGKLSNGGEDITLSDASGATVDFVEYDDKGEWPSMADGEGQSLQRRDANADSASPGNWESHSPTPGAPNRSLAAGLLPVFSDVEHTDRPAPGAPVTVTAKMTGAAAGSIVYRIGFGSEVVVTMSNSAGVVSATIPGQSAGALIRYRLVANENGRIGTWPRQGDGSGYRGTTVARTVATSLPVFEIFMTDADFAVMSADLTLRGDNGYPMVFAYEGQVFDNARMRVKGQVSRTFKKKKFKIILPPGYDLEDDDLFPDDVDEWGMHSSWVDKSFLRETLASEFMTEAGARAQQAFPVRFERNNSFLGLYTYVEQPDGTYRGRYGLDDSEVYEVGPDNLFGLLAANDSTRSQASLRARYDKETFEYLGDDELRRFIATVNGMSGATERNWLYDNADVPSIVNILAASMVIQNQDYGHKNYRLIFDQYGRVGLAQNDYDLTYGRRWSVTKGAFDSNVYVGGAFEHPGGPFFETFFFESELRQMVARRLRTLTEELLNPDVVNARALELAAQIRPEAVADRAIWGTYGGAADPTDEARRLVSSFVRPQYARLLGSYASSGRVARNTQPAVPAIIFDGVAYDGDERVSVRNISGDTVDLSGFEIPELDFVVPGGTVLLPGRTAVFVHEDIGSTRGGFKGLLFAGYFGESLLDAPNGVTLLNRSGTRVAAWDLNPPRQMTEISGRAARSAFVSLVATQPASPLYLQILACGATPGKTSNLNIDGSGQTRSVLALTRFAGDGSACIFNLGATHVVADVQGYLAEGALDDIDDKRLLDTRSGAKPAAGSVTTITGGRAGATGIVSLVATETEQPGYLSVVPCGTTAANTSNLNYVATNSTVAALTTIEFDAAGHACVYAKSPAHIVVDVQGYLADTAFDDVPDQRIIDTRSGAMPGARSMTVISGRPDSVGLMSLVATQVSAAGYLQVLPCDAAPGKTSNVNYDRPGITVNGLTTVRFGSDGKACVFSLAAAHIVADIQGYFVGDAFEDIPDVRVADTRID